MTSSRRSSRSRALATWVLALAAWCGLTAPAQAGRKPSASSSWVVLVHTSGAVPTGWPAALRAAAEASAGPRRFVPPPAATLDELQLALGCDGWNAACASVVADAAGAGTAVVVDVVARGSGLDVDARIVGPDGGVVASFPQLSLSGTGEAERVAAERWVAGLLRGVRPALLLVSSDLPGDEVFVDNVPAGRTPATIVDLAPGAHVLQLRRPGRAPAARTVTIAAGRTHVENLVLGAAGGATLTAPTVGTDSAPLPASSLSTAWAVTGVGVLVTGVGGFLGVVYGLPVVEALLNQESGGLRSNYTTFPEGRPVPAGERVDHLAQRFGTTPEIVRDQAEFSGVLQRATLLANVGVGLLLAGGALTATGVGLFFGADGGDDTPAPTANPGTGNGASAASPTASPTTSP
jgi:hypothetical protein